VADASCHVVANGGRDKVTDGTRLLWRIESTISTNSD